MKKTRTVKVRAEVDNRHEKLKPGMFAKVLLLYQSEKANSSPIVPNKAVQSDGQECFVFVPLHEGLFFKARCDPWYADRWPCESYQWLKQERQRGCEGSFPAQIWNYEGKVWGGVRPLTV